LGRKRTYSGRIVKCAFSFFRIKRFHRPIDRPTPWASRRVLSTRSKAHVHASEGDMGKCAYLVLTRHANLTRGVKLTDTRSQKKTRINLVFFYLSASASASAASILSSSIFLISTSTPCSIDHAFDLRYSLTSQPLFERYQPIFPICIGVFNET